ncbi:hypothetical protein [Tritonibacter aquimaris]|nr:hypothetical protein [Tritonibacter aquimaris]
MIFFRMFRLIILIGVAFVAGILFERYHQRDLCNQSGGQWGPAGYCVGK